MVIKQHKNGDSNIEFIKGKQSHNLRDTYVTCGNITSGRYLVYVEWEEQNEFSLICYGNGITSFTNLTSNYDDLKRDFLIE